MATHTVWARAPYLGTEEEVQLQVGRGGATLVQAEHDGVSLSMVRMTLTGKEDVDDLVEDSLWHIRASYHDKLGTEPRDQLVDAWEAALRKALSLAGVK